MKKTTEIFIQQSNIVHNNKFYYTNTIYICAKENVIITCKIHGDFLQLPKNHLRGCGCAKCAKNYTKNLEEIKINLNIIHNNKYDYSKILNIKTTKEKVIINCHKHGDFSQILNDHICGQGCPKCSGKGKDTKFFINECNLIHNNKYDYSLVVYKGAKEKITIICHKHGEFLQNPTDHLRKQGCPKCKSSKGETSIRNYLITNNIKFETQYTFEDCKFIKVLYFDFYLPEYNTCIEFNGEQHYRAVSIFGGEKSFKIQQKRDLIKYKYCLDNDINIIIIKYNENIEEKLFELFFLT